MSEDAFVVVGRVDWMGRLTVLFPSGRNRDALVRGGVDEVARSARFASRATFAADEGGGGSGFVFAIASRYPADLSSLALRDFSRWVTGASYVGRPAARYVGDPHRVVQRFSRVVFELAGDDWDYDVAFYSVDSPYYINSLGYASYCNGGGYGYQRYTPQYSSSRFLDYYDEDYYYGALGCRAYDMYACFTGFNPYANFYWANSYCGFQVRRSGQVATGPTPTLPPLGNPDTMRVNPWVPDSIRPPHPTRTSGPEFVPIDRNRPTPVQGWSDDNDLSYSIPGRALRGIRRNESPNPPVQPGTSGPMPLPGRPVIEQTNSPIEWVRPPRGIDQGGDVDRMPRRGNIGRSDPSSGPPRPFDPPPPRNTSPVFDRGDLPPRGSPAVRDFDGGRGYSPPPPSVDRTPPPPPPRVESRPPSDPPPRPPSTEKGEVKERKPPSEKPPQS